MVQGRGQKQRDQASSVKAAGDDPPRIGGVDRYIEHPPKAGNAQNQAHAVADRVNNLLGRTVLGRCVLNGYLPGSRFVARCKLGQRDEHL